MTKALMENLQACKKITGDEENGIGWDGMMLSQSGVSFLMRRESTSKLFCTQPQ